MEMNSDSENEEICTRPDILECGINATIPEKSRKKYETAYRAFMDWRSSKNVDSFSEDVLLTYFKELSEKYKSTSLWVNYSMLRSTLGINHKINIESYARLRAFLRRNSQGYQAKKAKTFTPDQINTFIYEAPDDKYLAAKVALIIGIMGACHTNELYSMSIGDIQDLGAAMLVTIPNRKTKIIREFTITGNFYHICKKYIDLRPPHLSCTSFFLNYQDGKCTAQNIGINKFSAMGKQIAKFLKLPTPDMYTGHSFRKSAVYATLVINAGGDITSLQGNIMGTISDPMRWLNMDQDMNRYIQFQSFQQNASVLPQETSGINGDIGFDMDYVNVKIEEDADDSRELDRIDTDMDRKNVYMDKRQTAQENTVGGYNVGDLIKDGRTKRVYDVPSIPGHCILLSKDRMVTGENSEIHDLIGKSAISNKTTCKVFEILNSVGIKTAFVKSVSDDAFLSRTCWMIPVEWVTSRLATGSFLKRHPGVVEGYKFCPPKVETFHKSDTKRQQQWLGEQIVSAQFKAKNVTIGKHEVDVMTKTSILVFEVLEKVWQNRQCSLIDLKIEFGTDENGEILVADVIDSNSWRLWPNEDKQLAIDTQTLTTVTDKDLNSIKVNFEWVIDQLDRLTPPSDHLVVVIMESPSDIEFCNKIRKSCEDLGLQTELRISSAHKTTEYTLEIISYYESLNIPLVFIAVAGRSNGLGPVISGNTDFPVINCPSGSKDDLQRNIWSSLNVSSGLGCGTVMYPKTAAMLAAQSISLTNYIVWCKLRAKRLGFYKSLPKVDKKIRNNC